MVAPENASKRALILLPRLRVFVVKLNISSEILVKKDVKLYTHIIESVQNSRVKINKYKTNPASEITRFALVCTQNE